MTPEPETLDDEPHADHEIVATEGVEDSETAEDATEAEVAPKHKRGKLIACAVLTVALLAAAGLTGWLYFTWYRPDQQTNKAASQRALDAAKDGTVAALSYSPEDLDKDLANAKSHLTGDFLKYYSDFTDQVVRPAVKQKNVSTTANVVQAAVSDMHPDNATVLVFVNQTTTSADRADPSMATSSVVVKLSKVDGKWLISEFNPV